MCMVEIVISVSCMKNLTLTLSRSFKRRSELWFVVMSAVSPEDMGPSIQILSSISVFCYGSIITTMDLSFVP